MIEVDIAFTRQDNDTTATRNAKHTADRKLVLATEWQQLLNVGMYADYLFRFPSKRTLSLMCIMCHHGAGCQESERNQQHQLLMYEVESYLTRASMTFSMNTRGGYRVTAVLWSTKPAPLCTPFFLVQNSPYSTASSREHSHKRSGLYTGAGLVFRVYTESSVLYSTNCASKLLV